MKKWNIVLFVTIALCLFGCSQEPEADKTIVTDKTSDESVEPTDVPVTETDNGQHALTEVAELLGMQDEETKDLLGGGF